MVVAVERFGIGRDEIPEQRAVGSDGDDGESAAGFLVVFEHLDVALAVFHITVVVDVLGQPDFVRFCEPGQDTVGVALTVILEFFRDVGYFRPVEQDLFEGGIDDAPRRPPCRRSGVRAKGLGAGAAVRFLAAGSS